MLRILLVFAQHTHTLSFHKLSFHTLFFLSLWFQGEEIWGQFLSLLHFLRDLLPICRFPTLGAYIFKERVAEEEVVPRDNVFSCGYCSNDYRSSCALELHAKSHTNSPKHSCEHCGKSFESRQARTSHLSRCSAAKPVELKKKPPPRPRLQLSPPRSAAQLRFVMLVRKMITPALHTHLHTHTHAQPPQLHLKHTHKHTLCILLPHLKKTHAYTHTHTHTHILTLLSFALSCSLALSPFSFTSHLISVFLSFQPHTLSSFSLSESHW